MAKKFNFLLVDPVSVSSADQCLPHAEGGPEKVTDKPLGAPFEDMEYFQARAEQELARAQRSIHAVVVAAHYELAERYLERVSRSDEEQS